MTAAIASQHEPEEGWETRHCQLDIGSDAPLHVVLSLMGTRVSVELGTNPPGPLHGLGPADLASRYLRLADAIFAQHPDVLTLNFSGPPFAHTGLRTPLSRRNFYASTALWYRGDNAGSHSESWLEGSTGIRHPKRKPLPDGELYRRYIASLGREISLRRLDIDHDLGRFTAWMNQPRVAQFWEQAWPESRQRRYLEEVLADAHKQPIVGSFDGEPFGYFEVYWALEDRLGPYYDAHPYDRGVHLLVGEKRFLGRRFFEAWMYSICHFMFLDDPRTQRLVGEPRHDNAALLQHIPRLAGWRMGGEFDFPHKRARLLTCERDAFFEEVRLG